MRKYIFAIFVSLLFVQNSWANYELNEFIDETHIVGKGKLSFLFWDIYDATLYAADGEWSNEKPFVLSLHYLMDLDGKDIADRTIKEMRGQGFDDEVLLASWHSQLEKIFPNVGNGTTLSALFIPGESTFFYHERELIGFIKGDEFINKFSGIWLDKKTSEKKLREKLLGIK